MKAYIYDDFNGDEILSIRKLSKAEGLLIGEVEIEPTGKEIWFNPSEICIGDVCFCNGVSNNVEIIEVEYYE